MGVQNRLTPAQPMKDKAIEFQVNGESVKLSPSIVRNYLVNGNGNITDQEVAYFMNLCKYQKLNPLTKEVYLIKYGSSPATIVTGKDAMTKRAMRNPSYAGQQAGVIVLNKETRELTYRQGALVLEGESLVGGWAKVYVKGYQIPIESAVSFTEYVQMKDGQPNSMWRSKPGTMIRKVALVQALREAFPEDLGGLYDSSEMGVDIDEPGAPAPIEVEPQPAAPEPETAPMVDDYYPGFDEPMEELPLGDF